MNTVRFNGKLKIVEMKLRADKFIVKFK